jgi:hypothetical protein
VCPFVHFGELAEAHERGDAVAVKWRLLRQHADDLVRPLVQAAHTQPQLRMLFPFTSHQDLHFSRCTGYPYSRDLPFIQHLPGGRYLVAGPTRSTVIGEADDPAAAIALLVAALPAECGPAVVGTVDDLPKTQPHVTRGPEPPTN